jgi:ATPase subunit of ABC transporter with duplicated ATPase domains
MGYVDVAGVGHTLPDGRQLFADVSFRVGEGAKVALVGPNGAGKTTLLRMVAGDLPVKEGTVARSGGLGVMRQFIGMVGDETVLGDFALSLAPPGCEPPAAAGRGRGAMHAVEKRGKYSTAAGTAQIRYADALGAWGEHGGYDAEVLFDTASVAVLDQPWDSARTRPVRTLSGGQQKRFALELLLRGPEEVLLLDEPDNFLDVPGKRWLEGRIRESGKSVLYVSHDRELLARTADRVVAVEGGSAWVHPGGFASWHDARTARHERLEERRRRWDEEHAKLRELMLMYKQKAAYNDAMASRYQAAQTRLRKFEEAGPPPLPPKEQDIRMRLAGGRTGKRAVMCEQLEMDGLTYPFDLELWYGDRLAVLGANGTGKSHFLRLLARGGSDPDAEHAPVDGRLLAPVAHEGKARLGARVRPGHFSQTHDRPDLVDRTLVEILWRGDERRAGMARDGAMKALSGTSWPAQAISASARCRRAAGAVPGAAAGAVRGDAAAARRADRQPGPGLGGGARGGLKAFDGTVIAVTHDRWFTRSFDRFVLFRGDGEVVETPEPVWD